MEDTSSTTTTELIDPTLMGIPGSPTTSSVKWKCMVSRVYEVDRAAVIIMSKLLQKRGYTPNNHQWHSQD